MTKRSYSNSEVDLTANFGHVQTSAPNQFILPIAVVFGIATELGVEYAPATVCADGAPTVTFEYLGADDSWHTTSALGAVSGTCVNVGGFTSILIVETVDGYGSTLQAKILSVSLRFTGPDGTWTATAH